MKLKIWSIVLILSLLPLWLSANTDDKPTCSNQSTCIDEKNFRLDVKRVSKRGSTVIVQVEYLCKNKLAINYSKGFVELMDAKGNEFKIDGKEISTFYLYQGENKVVSFKFKSTKDKQITEPFDLIIKADRPHGELTLFDLKSKN